MTLANEYEDKPVESTEKSKTQDMSREELQAQGGEELPDREAMSLIDLNVAAPVNAAVAANVLSDNATATADAAQQNDISQAT
jgi:hypothetical protein